MFRKTKLNLLVILIVLVLPTLALSIQAQDDVILTVWHQFTGEDEAIWSELVAKFEEANPNITIVGTPYQAEDLLSALTIALPAGEGPDLAYLDASSSFLGAVVEANLAVDLTPHYDSRGWNETAFVWARDKTAYNEGVYGVGGFAEIVGIYYRADLFEEFGLEPLSTWEAMIAAADRALEESLIPFNVGGLEGWPYSHFCGVLIHSMVANDVIAEIELLDGELTYSDVPEAIQAVQTCQDWTLEAGYYPADTPGISQSDALGDFIAGSGLMRIDGSWNVPSYITSEFDIQFAPFPMANDDIPVQAEGGISSTWMIASDTEVLDTALTFLDFIVFSDTANATWMESGLIPVVDFDASEIEIPSLLVSNLDGIATVSEGNGLGYWIGFMADPIVTDAFSSAWSGLLLGDIDAEMFASIVSDGMLQARSFRN